MWGAGGEIARGFYGDSNIYLGRHDLVSVKNYLIKKKIIIDSQLVALSSDTRIGLIFTG